jgi:hypothetical protein
MATRLTPRQGVIRAVVLLLGCAGLLGYPSFEISAQQVRLRPQADLHLPTRISLQNGVLHASQKIAVNVGARLTVTFNQRFDVITGVTYSPGYAMLRGAGKQFDVGTGSHLLTVSTGARYWLLPPARRLAWEVHTGLGVVFGAQRAYQDLFESSTVSGILGTTLRYQIGRIVSLHLRVRDRLYRVRFGAHNTGSSRPPLQISFGLGLTFLEPAP